MPPQILIVNEPDSSFRAALPQTEAFDGRFAAVGFCSQNQRIERGAGHPGNWTPLADRRQAKEFNLRGIDAGGARRNFYRRGGCFDVSRYHGHNKAPMTRSARMNQIAWI
jgi:hypothetical protein